MFKLILVSAYVLCAPAIHPPSRCGGVDVSITQGRPWQTEYG